MPLKIIEVQPRSLAAKAGITAQDTILSINSMPVNDFFDLEYYSNDYQLQFDLLDSANAPKSTMLYRQSNKALGIEPEPYIHGTCHNHCVFCFIDQLPPNLRASLYKKDDDYLYSYVFGNYITLSNLKPAELKRIIEQHISPLYISVHSTDPALRKSMMRHTGDMDLLKTLQKLARNGIYYHLQIVCVPGYNDGEQLRSTLTALLHKNLATLSVGIVPVGLTRFRSKLTPLKPFDASGYSETLAIIDEFRLQKDIVYAADEFYVNAGFPIPEADYYGEFPQLENGIGMLRLLQENFQRKKRSFVKELDKSETSFLLLTSKLAYSTVESIATYLNSKLTKSKIRVQTLRNNFFGEHISVSGLLTASDILSQQNALPDESIILPSNVFNHEGVTLDDVSQIDLRAKLNRPLLLVDQLFEDWDWI